MPEGIGTDPPVGRATGDGRGELPAPVVSGGRNRDWIGIAANAGSGRGLGRDKVRRLVRELRRADLRVRIAWTPDERGQLVAESADDPRCRCLVAVGGDGTVGALVNECPRVPITVLPAGTENLFASHFRLGRDPVRLAATIIAGRTATIDLGLAPVRRFTLMAGFGFDADVVTRHHLARVRHTGVPRPTHRGMYVDPVLRSSFGYRFPPITVTITDPGREETLVGSTVFIFNLPRYALGLPFAPTARGDDGLLDVVVFRDPGPFRALHYLWLVLCGLHRKRAGIEHRKMARVVVTAAEQVPVQLDGDPAGFVNGSDESWSTEVLPGAIEVLVPPAFTGAETVRVASRAVSR
jgi:diacylglycerol kinase (ATP)